MKKAGTYQLYLESSEKFFNWIKNTSNSIDNSARTLPSDDSSIVRRIEIILSHPFEDLDHKYTKDFSEVLIAGGRLIQLRTIAYQFFQLRTKPFETMNDAIVQTTEMRVVSEFHGDRLRELKECFQKIVTWSQQTTDKADNIPYNNSSATQSLYQEKLQEAGRFLSEYLMSELFEPLYKNPTFIAANLSPDPTTTTTTTPTPATASSSSTNHNEKNSSINQRKEKSKEKKNNTKHSSRHNNHTASSSSNSSSSSSTSNTRSSDDVADNFSLADVDLRREEFRTSYILFLVDVIALQDYVARLWRRVRQSELSIVGAAIATHVAVREIERQEKLMLATFPAEYVNSDDFFTLHPFMNMEFLTSDLVDIIMLWNGVKGYLSQASDRYGAPQAFRRGHPIHAKLETFGDVFNEVRQSSALWKGDIKDVKKYTDFMNDVFRFLDPELTYLYEFFNILIGEQGYVTTKRYFTHGLHLVGGAAEKKAEEVQETDKTDVAGVTSEGFSVSRVFLFYLFHFFDSHEVSLTLIFLVTSWLQAVQSLCDAEKQFLGKSVFLCRHLPRQRSRDFFLRRDYYRREVLPHFLCSGEAVEGVFEEVEEYRQRCLSSDVDYLLLQFSLMQNNCLLAGADAYDTLIEDHYIVGKALARLHCLHPFTDLATTVVQVEKRGLIRCADIPPLRSFLAIFTQPQHTLPHPLLSPMSAHYHHLFNLPSDTSSHPVTSVAQVVDLTDAELFLNHSLAIDVILFLPVFLNFFRFLQRRDGVMKEVIVSALALTSSDTSYFQTVSTAVVQRMSQALRHIDAEEEVEIVRDFAHCLHLFFQDDVAQCEEVRALHRLPSSVKGWYEEVFGPDLSISKGEAVTIDPTVQEEYDRLMAELSVFYHNKRSPPQTAVTSAKKKKNKNKKKGPDVGMSVVVLSEHEALSERVRHFIIRNLHAMTSLEHRQHRLTDYDISGSELSLPHHLDCFFHLFALGDVFFAHDLIEWMWVTYAQEFYTQCCERHDVTLLRQTCRRGSMLCLQLIARVTSFEAYVSRDHLTGNTCLHDLAQYDHLPMLLYVISIGVMTEKRNVVGQSFADLIQHDSRLRYCLDKMIRWNERATQTVQRLSLVTPALSSEEVIFELEREKDRFYRENRDEFDVDGDDFSDGRMYDEYCDDDDDDDRDVKEIDSQSLYKKSRKAARNESTLLGDFDRYLAWKEKRKGKSKTDRICDDANDVSIEREKERKAAAAEAELLAILEKEEKQLEKKKKNNIKSTSSSAKKK